MNLFWSVSWYDSLLGAVERFFALPIQIALTILVLQVFTRGQSRWLWIAIAWHTIIDAFVVISISNWGIYATEGIVAIFGLVSVGIIFALRQPEPPASTQAEDLENQTGVSQVDLPPIEENLENIEGTRYTD
jgi:uncharacterized membrane protein YhfC